MTTTTYRLDESQNATLNSSGAATLTGIGPVQRGEAWEVEGYSVTLTAGNAIVRVYRGSPLVANQIDYTSKGLGDSSDTRIMIKDGEKLSVTWENGTTGAIATIHFYGTRKIPGRRAY